MKALFPWICLLGLGGGVPAAATEPMSPEVVLVVEGAKTTEGHVMVAVYDSEETFLKEPVLTRKAEPGPEGRTEITFLREELPSEFAISLYHDINDNGTMDTGFMRMPKEPYGFSNNPGFRMGPPVYADSIVKRDAVGSTMVIRLR
jgi:uncharacterized protein (DUF2141 family)